MIWFSYDEGFQVFTWLPAGDVVHVVETLEVGVLGPDKGVRCACGGQDDRVCEGELDLIRTRVI